MFPGQVIFVSHILSNGVRLTDTTVGVHKKSFTVLQVNLTLVSTKGLGKMEPVVVLNISIITSPSEAVSKFGTWRLGKP